MNIIRHSQTMKVEQYALVYEWNDMPGAGFSFPCDKQGNPFLADMPQPALENLAECQSGKVNVTFQGVKDYSYTYVEPAQGQCSCGRIVELAHFTNTCDCGLEYNFAGQLLAPRSQWNERPDIDYMY